ncbi:MAG TPA: nitroreductase family protein [Vicinamibacterales bacterium]|nr:nitroreductase family protein [Vicinamibacterales bacterium]
MSEAYERFLALVRARHTCRGFRPDPPPEGTAEKILEAARWAMSGANSQPWESIVVRNPGTIRALYQAYQGHVNDLNFWLEQRTFVVRTNAIERLWADDLDARYRQLAAEFEPGTPVRDAVLRARGQLTTEESHALDVCGLGHGIGITPEEAPALSERSSDTLASGMCLVIRSAMRAAGTFVVHGETTVL